MSRGGPAVSEGVLREKLGSALDSLRKGELGRAETLLKSVLAAR